MGKVTMTGDRTISGEGGDDIYEIVMGKGREVAKNLEVEFCLWCAGRLKDESKKKSGGKVSLLPFFCSPRCAFTYAIGRLVLKYDAVQNPLKPRPLIGLFTPARGTQK